MPAPRRADHSDVALEWHSGRAHLPRRARLPEDGLALISPRPPPSTPHLTSRRPSLPHERAASSTGLHRAPLPVVSPRVLPPPPSSPPPLPGALIPPPPLPASIMAPAALTSKSAAASPPGRTDSRQAASSCSARLGSRGSASTDAGERLLRIDLGAIGDGTSTTVPAMGTPYRCSLVQRTASQPASSRLGAPVAAAPPPPAELDDEVRCLAASSGIHLSVPVAASPPATLDDGVRHSLSNKPDLGSWDWEGSRSPPPLA